MIHWYFLGPKSKFAGTEFLFLRAKSDTEQQSNLYELHRQTFSILPFRVRPPNRTHTLLLLPQAARLPPSVSGYSHRAPKENVTEKELGLQRATNLKWSELIVCICCSKLRDFWPAGGFRQQAPNTNWETPEIITTWWARERSSLLIKPHGRRNSCEGSEISF